MALTLTHGVAPSRPSLASLCRTVASDESAVLTLALAVDNRYTPGRGERLAAYAAAFGVELGLPDGDIVTLHRGGYLHDVGKAVVPDAILRKPGRLTADEIATIQRHTIVGDWLCRDVAALQAVRPIVRHHHERFDGRGYPDGLRGPAIPLFAQVISIVDAYDALITNRADFDALSEEAACAELCYEAACGWRSPELVARFVSLSRRGQLRSLADAPWPSASVLLQRGPS